ncbi:MAG: polysaccharide deacetylase family protein [Melioribacteraceae bacterium]|nr:polysaccharide deacetylase family protein [Melioribacteraceae bacterium]
MIKILNNGLLKVIGIIFSITLLLSCEKTIKEVNGGGVVITFDDYFISDWYNADLGLQKYDWKATFFISNLNTLSEEDFEKLRLLQSKGHEVGSHGLNHKKAKEYSQADKLDEYIQTDILPSIEILEKNGLKINSFAYPGGARTKDTDEVLLDHFNIIRATTYGKTDAPEQKNYANGSRIVFGLGIDNSYGNYEEYLLKLLEYARVNNLIVIFYAHRISDEQNLPKQTVSIHVLEAICKFVKNNDMKFMTMRDLIIEGN